MNDNLIDNLLLKLIMAIHFLVVLFVILTPFFGNNALLFLHMIIIPFIIFHWYLNDDTCALTHMETFIRTKMNNNIKAKEEDCFTYRLISPIYKFRYNHNNYSLFMYITTWLLWLISVSRLYYNLSRGQSLV